MSKLKIKNNYGITPNIILNREDLSLKAKGLFGFLQSKPDGWKFSVARIEQQTKDGKDAIKYGLQELEKMGYLQRIPIKNKEGRWGGYDYVLSEKPFTEKPSTGKPFTENLSSFSKKDNSKKEVVKKNIDNNTAEDKSSASQFTTFIKDFFINSYKTKFNALPAIDFGKDLSVVRKASGLFINNGGEGSKDFSRAQKLVLDFLNSKKAREAGYTLSVCFSTHTINQWQAGKLDKYINYKSL